MAKVARRTGDETARGRVELNPLPVPKSSDVLASDLRERILRGELEEGTALPTERDLVTQTRMSRTTVREAMRILEVQGFVTIRTGRTGGAFVRRPDGEGVANSVALLIRGQKIRIPSLLETREAIEPFCAQLAAANRTDAELEELERANDAITTPGISLDEFLQANVDWHIAVAVASHNEVLSGVMTALSRAIYAAMNTAGFVDSDVRKAAIRSHRTITDAIANRDPDAAVRRMRRHVHTYAEAVLKVEQRLSVELPPT